jgi:hypothetical protein
MADDDNNMTPTERLASALQYGTADDSVNAVQTIVNAALQHRVEQAEVDRSAEFLKGFHEKNQDVVTDQEAMAVAQRAIMDAFQEDFDKLGFSRDEIKRRLGRDPTDEELSRFHMQMRSHQPGKVRSFEDCVVAATERARDHRDGTSGHRHAVVKAVQQRLDQTRKLRGEMPAGQDFIDANAPQAPAKDPQITKYSNTVAAMKAARQTARAAPVHDFIGRGSRKGAA